MLACNVTGAALCVQDFIDIEKETGKLSGKRERLQGQLQKVEDAMAKDDYISKVPEAVREQNTTKVGWLLVELTSLFNSYLVISLQSVHYPAFLRLRVLLASVLTSTLLGGYF